jgi:hypothetical protein
MAEERYFTQVGQSGNFTGTCAVKALPREDHGGGL